MLTMIRTSLAPMTVEVKNTKNAKRHKTNIHFPICRRQSIVSQFTFTFSGASKCVMFHCTSINFTLSAVRCVHLCIVCMSSAQKRNEFFVSSCRDFDDSSDDIFGWIFAWARHDTPNLIYIVCHSFHFILSIYRSWRLWRSTLWSKKKSHSNEINFISIGVASQYSCCRCCRWNLCTSCVAI